MSEHSIRLRGAWQWHDLDDLAAPPRRVALPIAWPPDSPARVRLVRQFGLPPIDPARERLVLRIANAPGLLAVRLNDCEIAGAAATGPAYAMELVQLPPLLARNGLSLDVDGHRASAAASGEPGWGEVALVVVPLDDPIG
jgi:hypothetical protein